MPRLDIDLTELQYLASIGGYSGNKTLSDTTALLCLILLNEASPNGAWRGAFLDGLTPLEQDEKDAIVGLATSEIMENFTSMLELPRYQYLYPWAFEPRSPTTVVKSYSASAYNGQFIWTNSNANGDQIYVPLQLKAGDYKIYYNYFRGTTGGTVNPEIWDAFASLVISLTSFDTYFASGSYNIQRVDTFTLPVDIESGFLNLVIGTSPSLGTARSLTLQEIIIVGVE